jgi:hypothetical protein
MSRSERLMKRIAKQASRNPDVDVLVFNVYTTANRWDDAIRVRSKMAHPSKKTAGWSLIEVKG